MGCIPATTEDEAERAFYDMSDNKENRMNWRLDIDESNIYCGDRLVASLDNSSGTNDEWRESLRLGAEIVERMNAPAREWHPFTRELEYLTRCADGTIFRNIVQMPAHAVEWSCAAWPAASLSWNGFNVHGDPASIAAVKALVETRTPRKPLTVEQINAMPEAGGWWPYSLNDRIMRLIRAVERAQGVSD